MTGIHCQPIRFVECVHIKYTPIDISYYDKRLTNSKYNVKIERLKRYICYCIDILKSLDTLGISKLGG